MAKSKLSPIELQIKHYIPKEVDYSYQRSISYSQFNVFQQCPHRWSLENIHGHKQSQSNINLIFGTAFHETIQSYIKTMYEISGAEADRMNLENIFQEKFTEIYKTQYTKSGEHFSNPSEMREYYEDGLAILRWIKTRRNKLFTIRKVKLLGIELPLIQEVGKNLFFKGYIDFILYDEDLQKVYIYDIKTSKSTWNNKQKKDDNKLAQILLYKEFFSKTFGFDIDKIEVEYFIVKRKIWEDSEFPIPRVQSFKPASGKTKRKQATENFNTFIKECFDESGKHIQKSYIRNIGEESCKWCPFSENNELCGRKPI